MLLRITRWSTRRPRAVLAVWGLLALVLGAFSLTAPDHVKQISIATRGSESQRADDRAAHTFGRSTAVTVLLSGPDRAVRRQAETVTRRLRAGHAGRRVLSPLDADVRRRAPGAANLLRPAPGRVVLMVSAPTTEAIDGKPGDAVRAIVRHAVTAPVRADVTGYSVIGGEFVHRSLEETRGAEEIAIPVLIVILLLVFRTPVAAGVPLLLGIVTVLMATGIMALLARVTAIPDSGMSMASVMGLALGVDYSLLMVSRYREERRRGLDAQLAVMTSATTAGRTVIAAGAAVAVVILGAMAAAPSRTAVQTTYGLVASAGCGVLGALIAVPAFLTLFGRHIDRWRIGGEQRDDGGVWATVARWAQRRPFLALLPGVAVVVVLGPLALGLDTGTTDPRILPPGNEVRLEFERVARTAGPGLVTPFQIDATSGHRERPGAALAFVRRLKRDPGVALVIGPAPHRVRGSTLDALTVSGTTRRYIVIPGASPDRGATAALTDRLRRDSGRYARASGATVRVGGVAAQLTDTSRIFASGFTALVITLSILTMLALVVILRALLLPLICMLINLVTAIAAMGALSLLSTGKDPLLGGAGFIDQFVLLGLFAVVFALGLDYQVFILGRIREEWVATGSVQGAVSAAIGRTMRVVTGAAAIMMAVFASFALPELQTIRQTGVCYCVAIAVDATLVRVILLPACTSIAGDACFWLPGWLDRLLPRVDVEGVPQPA